MNPGLIKNKIVYLHRLITDMYINDRLVKKNTVVYVGSGSVNRYKSKSDRSELHINSWHNIYFQVVFTDLTQNEALSFENQLIERYWSDNIFNKKREAYPVTRLLYSEVSEVFYLDQDGVIRWAVDRLSGIRMKIIKAKKGDKAGYEGKRGYWFLRFKRKSVKLHRIVWVLHNKRDLDPNLVVDHKDRNRSNNHPDNLTATTHSENNKNKHFKLSQLGVKRVRFSEKQKLFHVQWTVDGRKFHKYFCITPLLKSGLTYSEAYSTCLENAKEFAKTLSASSI